MSKHRSIIYRGWHPFLLSLQRIEEFWQNILSHLKGSGNAVNNQEKQQKNVSGQKDKRDLDGKEGNGGIKKK